MRRRSSNNTKLRTGYLTAILIHKYIHTNYRICRPDLQRSFMLTISGYNIYGCIMTNYRTGEVNTQAVITLQIISYTQLFLVFNQHKHRRTVVQSSLGMQSENTLLVCLQKYRIFSNLIRTLFTVPERLINQMRIRFAVVSWILGK